MSSCGTNGGMVISSSSLSGGMKCRVDGWTGIWVGDLFVTLFDPGQ